MKNDSYFDIDTSSPEIVSIIREDANSFKTCHLCGENKPQMMLSFITSKLDHVDRDFWDYAAFVWMWVLSTLSLLARWHSRVMTKVPWNRFYQLIPLHLWICKECMDKKTNRRWKLVLKESDYKKHPLYPRAKELWYKKVLFQESYTVEDLQWKSFQKDLLKIRKLVEEMDDWLNVPQTNNINNDNFLSNDIIDMSKKVYDEYGFDEEGYNREGYDAYWYDKEWFNKEWWNKKWYDRNWYDEDWFNVKWYDMDWYDREWYNVEWYDRKWFNKEWRNKKWINKKTGKEYDKRWYNVKWYNEDWYSRNWFDGNWYDKYGFNLEWIHRLTKTKYWPDWYDRYWYDKDWYDISWKNREWGFRDKKAKREAHLENYGCLYFFWFLALIIAIMAIISSFEG